MISNEWKSSFNFLAGLLEGSYASVIRAFFQYGRESKRNTC